LEEERYFLNALKIEDPRIKQSYLFTKLKGNKVQCQTCSRYCIIEDGDVGLCKTKKNVGGILYTLIYGDVSSYSLNPIEKKPAYHYYPGSISLTLGSWSCNFDCDWCLNWDISKRPPPEDFSNASLMSAEKIVENATFNPSINGVCFSFNEPTLSLELIIDIFHLLSDNYYKHLVTNGYMSTKALDMFISSGMSGMTVSFKGTKNVVDTLLNINIDHIWNNIQIAFQRGIHIELVYLVIPSVNDDEEFINDFSKKVIKKLSTKVPIHFTRYFPSHLSTQPKTPVSLLQKAHTIAKKEGLDYVYLGNVPGHPFQNTYCPNCSELLIKRDSFSITFSNLTVDNRCPRCNYPIHIFPYRPQYTY